MFQLCGQPTATFKLGATVNNSSDRPRVLFEVNDFPMTPERALYAASVDSAIPSIKPIKPVKPVNRLIKMAENAKPPLPKRKVHVRFNSFHQAEKAELSWVQQGDTGMRVTVENGAGRKLLLAIYIAVKVRSIAQPSMSDDPKENGALIVVVDVRYWPAFESEQKQLDWRKKLSRNNGERMENLRQSLEYLFSFVDPVHDRVVQFLGGPATTREAAARAGYQFFLEEGRASTKVQVDDRLLREHHETCHQFYLTCLADYWISWRRYWWRAFSPNLETKFLAGSKLNLGRLPDCLADMTKAEESALYAMTAEYAAPIIASFASIAWAGDDRINSALQKKNLAVSRGTRLSIAE